MTDKNMVKLLIGWGVPKEKHDAIIAKANKEDEEMDVNEFLTFSKEYAGPLLKPGIEKEAMKAGATGAIKKSLTAVYNATKVEGGPTFEEWEKSLDGKDYAEVIKESLVASKLKGVSTEDAIKEYKEKLELAMKENGETKASIETMKQEYEGKLAQKDFEVTWDKTITSFEKKPLNPKSYKYFKNDLDEEGIEAKLHEGKITLFKKGETTPMQNDKKTAFVTLEEKYNNWATENVGQFVNSAGNNGGAGEDVKQSGTKSDDGKFVTKPGHRPAPVLVGA